MPDLWQVCFYLYLFSNTISQRLLGLKWDASDHRSVITPKIQGLHTGTRSSQDVHFNSLKNLPQTCWFCFPCFPNVSQKANLFQTNFKYFRTLFQSIKIQICYYSEQKIYGVTGNTQNRNSNFKRHTHLPGNRSYQGTDTPNKNSSSCKLWMWNAPSKLLSKKLPEKNDFQKWFSKQLKKITISSWTIHKWKMQFVEWYSLQTILLPIFIPVKTVRALRWAL